MKLQERVAASAQLQHIKGSAEQRAAIATNKTEAFVKDFEGIIKEKFEITKDEFQGLLTKHAPGVDVSVHKAKNDAGLLSYKNEGRTFTGYEMFLPTLSYQGKEVINGGKKGIIAHEMRHLFDCIVSPKFAARDNVLTNTKSVLGALKQIKYAIFYKKNLYSDEKRAPKLEDLKKKIEKAFGLPRATSNEKIETLQQWRYRLQSEKNAYADEKRLTKGTDDEQFLLHVVHNFFHLEKKIDAINEVLREEITRHRQAHTKKLQKG